MLNQNLSSLHEQEEAKIPTTKTTKPIIIIITKNVQTLAARFVLRLQLWSGFRFLRCLLLLQNTKFIHQPSKKQLYSECKPLIKWKSSSLTANPINHLQLVFLLVWLCVCLKSFRVNFGILKEKIFFKTISMKFYEFLWLYNSLYDSFIHYTSI